MASASNLEPCLIGVQKGEIVTRSFNVEFKNFTQRMK